MKNKFTQFVFLVVFLLEVLAFGLARMTKAASGTATAAGSEGVTEAAPASEVAGAASPGGLVGASGEGRVVSGEPNGALGTARPTSAAVIANPAPLEGLLAVLIPLAIAWLKSAVKLPDQYRKWIPVFAPVFGELVTSLATSLPHGSGALAGLAAVGVREIKDQHLPGVNSDAGRGASGEPKSGTTYGGVLSMVALGMGLMLLLGCAGCAHLDPKGIYAGDKFAYDQDFVIDGAYDALDAFVQWHRANAGVVDAQWPEVAAFAKQLEDGDGDQWIDDALDLRDAYSKNPSADNRTKLQKAVAVLQTALVKVPIYEARLSAAPKTN